MVQRKIRMITRNPGLGKVSEPPLPWHPVVISRLQMCHISTLQAKEKVRISADSKHQVRNKR